MCKSDTCSICLDSCVVPHRIDMRRRNIRTSGELKRIGEKLRCGHVFHRQCILPWFLNVENEASDNCPMCRQHILFSNKVGMFNWRLFSRKTHLWNIAELKRQEEEYDQDYEDYAEYQHDQQADEEESIDIEDTDIEDIDVEDDEDELSSISSSDTDESDWFDADDWTDAPLRRQQSQSSAYYDRQLSFIRFAITQQKLTLNKLHAMRFNPLTNNICRNRHR